MNISIVVLAKNSSRNIKQCLKVLEDFDNIVVYDNGSTDGTQAICTSFDNVELVEGDFLGFGNTKNKAASFAKNPWILSLDSDEVLSQALINTLKKMDLDKDTVYAIKRRNFYKTQEIKYCWKNDTVLRLYHKEHTQFNNKLVHENIMTQDMKTSLLHGYIRHYSYQSVSDFIVKTDQYSTLFAEQNRGKKRVSPFTAVTHSFFAFFKISILKRGFMDGYAGLLISHAQSSEKFYKYMKLYEKNKDL